MHKIQIAPSRLSVLPTVAALFTGLTCAAAGASLAPRSLRFQDPVSLAATPEVGTETSLAISVQRGIEGGDLTVFMNGGEVPKQFLPELSFEVQSDLTMDVSETSVEPKDDGIGPWTRRLIESAATDFQMEMAYDDQENSSSASATCKAASEPFLVGRDADGEAVAQWADDDSKMDPALLSKVRPGLQLRGLLPEEAIETGATWESDAGALGDILLLDSTLPWDWSGDGEAPESGDTALSGGLDMKATEIRDEDSQVLVTVEFTGELVEVATRATDLAQVPVADGTATEVTTTTYALEGEFTWNATAGTLVSLEMEGEGEGIQRIDKDAGQEGGEYYSTTVHTSSLKIMVN